MQFTVDDFLKESKYMLKKWEKEVQEIENGTFKYDNTMPKSCVNALCYSKVNTYKKVIAYLETLPLDLISEHSPS